MQFFASANHQYMRMGDIGSIAWAAATLQQACVLVHKHAGCVQALVAQMGSSQSALLKATCKVKAVGSHHWDKTIVELEGLPATHVMQVLLLPVATEPRWHGNTSTSNFAIWASFQVEMDASRMYWPVVQHRKRSNPAKC
jgi:hypothetical protein